MSKDYYKILGVSKSASKEEIKKAYRRLAHEFHPDKHSDEQKRKVAEEKFKEISEAYHVLSNDQRRQQYDTFGSSGPSGFQGNGMKWDFGGFDPRNFSGAGGFDFGDIFEDFFGGGSGHSSSGAQQGSDLRYDLEISLEEAATGTEKQIRYRRHCECKYCQGSGAEPGTSKSLCSTCNVTGQI